MSIQVGNLIKFKYDGMIIEKRLADDSRNNITPFSPIGQALIDKKVGDKFNVRTPGGIVGIEILVIG